MRMYPRPSPAGGEPAGSPESAASRGGSVARAPSALAAVLLALAATRAVAGEDPAPVPPLRLAQEASLAAKSKLCSGHGSGTFEHANRSKGPNPYDYGKKADFVIHFDKPKYRIDLTFRGETREGLTRLIIIFDGKAIFVSERSKLHHPSGALGRVRDLNRGRTEPADVGFPFDPCKLPSYVCDCSALNASAVTTRREIDGTYVGKYAAKFDGREFRFSERSGYNAERMTATLERSGLKTFDSSATWEYDAGQDVWFVKSLHQIRASPNGAELESTLTFLSFSPNAPVDPAVFQFESLEFPPGTRILDDRAKSAGQSYKVGPVTPPGSKEIDAAIESLSADTATESRARRGPLRKVFYIAGSSCVLLSGIWVLAKRRGRAAPPAGSV